MNKYTITEYKTIFNKILKVLKRFTNIILKPDKFFLKKNNKHMIEKK